MEIRINNSILINLLKKWLIYECLLLFLVDTILRTFLINTIYGEYTKINFTTDAIIVAVVTTGGIVIHC